jgi:hypothetical protein
MGRNEYANQKDARRRSTVTVLLEALPLVGVDGVGVGAGALLQHDHLGRLVMLFALPLANATAAVVAAAVAFAAAAAFGWLLLLLLWLLLLCSACAATVAFFWLHHQQ